MKWVARRADHHGAAEERYRTRGSDRRLAGLRDFAKRILQTAKDIREPSVLNRAGGAPTLAVGIAHVFHKVLPMAEHGLLVSLRYLSKPCSS
ncbi:hypothetical protein ACNKHV_27395 [Shigella flexneri]